MRLWGSLLDTLLRLLLDAGLLLLLISLSLLLLLLDALLLRLTLRLSLLGLLGPLGLLLPLRLLGTLRLSLLRPSLLGLTLPLLRRVTLLLPLLLLAAALFVPIVLPVALRVHRNDRCEKQDRSAGANQSNGFHGNRSHISVLAPVNRHAGLALTFPK